MRKPHPKSTKEEKLDFIQKKYAEKLFVDEKRETITSMSHPDAELLKIPSISGDVSEIMGKDPRCEDRFQRRRRKDFQSARDAKLH